MCPVILDQLNNIKSLISIRLLGTNLDIDKLMFELNKTDLHCKVYIENEVFEELPEIVRAKWLASYGIAGITHISPLSIWNSSSWQLAHRTALFGKGAGAIIPLYKHLKNIK